MSKSYNAEIVAVGTELLLGDILNTNARFLSKELAQIGIGVYFQTVVGDNRERLINALTLALNRADIVITSGGLGPTYDDITKETVCELLGIPLLTDEETKKHIEEYFIRRGRVMTENNMKQALVPEGGTVLYNENGTAPGLCIKKDNKIVFMLPGPPRELEPLFLKCVKPILCSLHTDRVFVSKTLNIFGMGESAVEARLIELMKASTNPTVAPYAKDGEVLLRITASACSEHEASAMIDAMIDKITSELGEYVYGIDGESLQNVLVSRFAARGLTVSTAESCTGGLVAKRITEIPGSSQVIGCGIVAYSNDMKISLLGVNPETIEKYGAVSEQTAREMAVGVRRVSGSDIAVSVTGIAGPGGGIPEKPVGLVYIAAASEAGVVCEKLTLGRSKNEREYVRYLASSSAIALALRVADEFNAVREKAEQF
ncbi:MAG: competence/damage-inducible protein A [Oscillospiraceae bacterium]|nr:competence/damage-inducible protein A [Oscillospiraceae bacterium]